MFLFHWPRTSAGALSQRGVTTMTAKLSATSDIGGGTPLIVGTIRGGREYGCRTSLLSIFILTMKRENGRWKQTDSDTCTSSHRVIQCSSVSLLHVRVVPRESVPFVSFLPYMLRPCAHSHTRVRVQSERVVLAFTFRCTSTLCALPSVWNV